MMIELVVFTQQSAARYFSNILDAEHIRHRLAEQPDGWRLDVLQAEDYYRARELLDAFQQNPFDARFQKAALQGGARLMGSGLSRGGSSWWGRLGPVTRTVFVTCLVFFVVLWLSGDGFFRTMLFPESREVFAGQPWRVITPIFLHFGVLHLVFNLLWWQELAGVIERYQSSLQLLLVTLATAVISNYAQFAATGANFGGLSGVVYGLLGYLWLYGRVNPRAGYGIHRPIVILMLGWLVICFVFFADSVANQAHLYGLLSGSALGAAAGVMRRRAD